MTDDLYDENNPDIHTCPQCGGKRVTGTTPAKALADEKGMPLDASTTASALDAIEKRARKINMLKAALSKARVIIWSRWQENPESTKKNLDHLKQAYDYDGNIDTFWDLYKSFSEEGE